MKIEDAISHVIRAIGRDCQVKIIAINGRKSFDFEIGLIRPLTFRLDVAHMVCTYRDGGQYQQTTEAILVSRLLDVFDWHERELNLIEQMDAEKEKQT